MLAFLHWEGKLSNLTYHNISSFFFCSWMEVNGMKEWGKLFLWGEGWEKKGKNPCGGSSNIYFKLWQREKAWNVGFETLYSGQTMLSTRLVILNYPVILFHRCSTTVSSEPYPLNIFQTVLHMCSTSEKVRIYFNHKPKKHFILMI